MKIKDVRRKSDERFDVKYLQNIGIQSYGDRNDYPQVLHDVIAASPVGAECLDRYADFIEGNGFNDIAFSEAVLNRKGETADTLHAYICRDLAEYGGFAIHVNYNILGQIVEVHHVPFEQTRLDEPDDAGYVGFIMLHQDWRGRKSRKGNKIPVDKKHCTHVNRFNPGAVLSQVEACGGIEFYNGQILWYSKDGDMVYPTPLADRVITEMSADEGLSNVKWRNVRNNFLPAGMLITKKGQTNPMSDGNNETLYEDDGFSECILNLQGDTNACNILEVTCETDEDKPEFVPFSSKNYDKEYGVTEESVTARIYSAFGQEPWYCIRTGKVGFSGNIITDAYEYYNSITEKQRRAIERAFTAVMAHWHNPVWADFSVAPMKYISTSKSE